MKTPHFANDFFEKFAQVRVLIIGDVMVDRYMRGKVSRISPEAPVPVVQLSNIEDRLGGAANVALNIKAMGGQPLLISVIGKDEAGTGFLQMMDEWQLQTQGILQSADRKTTVKTRIVAGGQHLLRVDSEDNDDLSQSEESELLQRLEQIIREENPQVILFQDYNKGVLSLRMIESTIQLAKKHEIPTAVDPKKFNFWAYKGVSLFKPNLKEIRDSVPFEIEPDEESLNRASTYLRSRLDHQHTLITLSEKGIFYDDQSIQKILPTQPRSIADVSGAGDTVISIAALGLALGLDLDLIALLANLAGGQVCEKSGVVPVDLEVLKREYYQLAANQTGAVH